MNKTRKELQKEINDLKSVMVEKDKECEFNQLNSHSVIDRLESEKESWVMKFQTTKNELDRSNRMREEQQLIDIQLQTEIEQQVQVIKKQWSEKLDLEQLVKAKDEEIDKLKSDHEKSTEASTTIVKYFQNMLIVANAEKKLLEGRFAEIESKSLFQLIRWWLDAKN